MKINISISKVPLSLARPYMKGWDRNRYNSLFMKYEHSRNKYRIYLPLTGHEGQRIITVPPKVSEALESQGYVVEDYVAGLAVKADNPKKKIKIGKLLREAEIKQLYDNDPQRQSTKNVKQWVVISRHPYDLIGMSFDRGWTSCMNIEHGINKTYVKQDIKAGTLVAYLIKDLDKNINNPTARVLIKPFTNSDDDVITRN